MTGRLAHRVGFPSGALRQLLQRPRHLRQSSLDLLMHRAFGISIAPIPHTRLNSRERLYAFVNGGHCVDMEPAIPHGVDHLLRQEQVIDVVFRQQHALRSR